MHNNENCKLAVSIMQEKLRERKKPSQVKETLGTYGFQPGEGLNCNKLHSTQSFRIPA